jgi:hypothetical protein
VHADQLAHVQNGCLERLREDISMDGSRIEGSHKAWNSLQRAHASGIEVYTSLAHDFFLRRNLRIASARIHERRSVNCHEFIASAHASHHIQLVNHTAKLFNLLYEKEPLVSQRNLNVYPILPQVDHHEMIGLVKSAHSVTFGGYLEPKDEASPELDGSILLEDIDEQVEGMDQSRFIHSLGIDEALLLTKMPRRTPASIQVQTSVASTSTVPIPGAAGTSHSTNVASEHGVADPSASPRKRKGPGVDPIRAIPEEMTASNLDTPHSKRRRFTGPLSPSTLALGLPGTITPEFLATESACDTPEPLVSIFTGYCILIIL